VGPAGVIAFVSLFAPILPIRCSSDAKGTPMKPAVFYVVEDIAAVDFLEGRAYRYTINARYVTPRSYFSVLIHNHPAGTHLHRSDT
jgi:hypothetical protein